jgi:hypothetical protein
MFCRSCLHHADLAHNSDGECVYEIPAINFRMLCQDCTGLDAVPVSELFPTAIFDGGAFVGHQPRACGEHRTTGRRAWCFECSEWCYPHDGCIRCRYPEG